MEAGPFYWSASVPGSATHNFPRAYYILLQGQPTGVQVLVSITHVSTSSARHITSTISRIQENILQSWKKIIRSITRSTIFSITCARHHSKGDFSRRLNAVSAVPRDSVYITGDPQHIRWARDRV